LFTEDLSVPTKEISRYAKGDYIIILKIETYIQYVEENEGLILKYIVRGNKNQYKLKK